jgi:Arc/MetJ-type ribon-helix-helix transcriptional regulator
MQSRALEHGPLGALIREALRALLARETDAWVREEVELALQTLDDQPQKHA